MVASFAEAKELLYGYDLGDFVAERNVLVKQVRSGGDRELANEIKTLKKPSAVAAEVNRVVRADPGGIALILQAAGLLRDAQQGALEGSSINAAELQEQYRAAISALAQTASSRKPEVRAALEAATIDVASNDDLRMGALVAVPTPESIFGTVLADSPAAPTATKPEPEPARPAEDEVAKQRAKRQAAADSKAAAAAQKQTAAEQKAADAALAKELAAAEAAAAKAQRELEKEQARLRKQRKKERLQRRKQVAKEHRDAVRAHLTSLDAEAAAASDIDAADARIVEIDDEIESLEATLAELRAERPDAVAHRETAEQVRDDHRARSAEAEGAVTALADLLDEIDAEHEADV